MQRTHLFEKTLILGKIAGGKGMKESFPRQVDKKSRGPQGEKGLEFSRRKKGETFFPLHSLRLYNNNVSCLRTVSGLNLLANSVILKCKLWELGLVRSLQPPDTLWIHWKVYNSIANTRQAGTLSTPF